MKKALWFCGLLLAVYGLGAADFSVDLNAPDGAIKKALHGSGYMPTICNQANFNGNDHFKALNFTYSRTHDQALNNPGQRVVDTIFVFPLEKLDPADPGNYYFASTDYLLQNLVSCGTLPYYRLGVSIEHNLDDHHFNTAMPQDAKHYAKILAGIIRHYNHNWANGFQMNIPYWEIWNEPELPKMWAGNMAEFNEFFVTVLKELKSEFPDEKIGGAGFAKLNGGSAGEKILRELLALCKAQNIAPDFISFHHYGYDPQGALRYIGKVRKIIDEFGFTKTELHLNEWHYNIGFEWKKQSDWEKPFGNGGIDSAAYNIAMFAGFHDTPLDVSCYYGAGRSGGFGTWGFYDRQGELNRNYYSMKMIGDLVKNYPARVRASVDVPNEAVAPDFAMKSIIAGSSPDGKNAMILISDYRGTDEKLTAEIKGIPANAQLQVVRLDQENNDLEIPAQFADGILTLKKRAPGSAVFMVKISAK